MLETKEQKQIFAGSVALIIILGLVSFFSRPQFKYQDKTDYKALQAQSDKKQQAYAAYLASIGTTAKAQAELYREVLPASEVEAQVAVELDAAQTIVIPVKPQTIIKISEAGTRAAIENYLNSTAPIVDKIQTISKLSENDLFNRSGSVSRIDSLITDLNSSLSQFSQLPVPKPAAAFVSQQLIALEAYADLAKTSKAHMQGQNVWPQMYKDFAVLSETLSRAGSDFESLNKTYNLLGDSRSQKTAPGNWLVPAASAQILTTDVWAKTQDALRVAAATAVARFMLDFLNKLAVKIQEAYRITNYLYYTDALVAGQYADDYLNKYVDNAFDRNMIKNFIPSVSCGKTQNLAPLFQAKADQYLGFDPASLNPADPDYYQKLSRVGDFLSSPNGWQLYYEDVAAEANSAAQAAANQELTGSGNKSSRDIAGGILVTAQTTLDANRAVIENMLASGFAGAAGDPWTAKITSQITQTFLNNFVFQGTVLKEQKACISVPLVGLVTPLPLSAAP